MRPHLTLLTLGVADLERAVRFYRDGLGLSTKGIIGQEIPHGAVAFFSLQPGLRLAVWPRASMAHDTGLATTATPSNDVTLAHNVASRTDVDAVMAEAEKAGARIVKQANETSYGGYAGYFADPDGHLWEIAWNPHLDEL